MIEDREGARAAGEGKGEGDVRQLFEQEFCGLVARLGRTLPPEMLREALASKDPYNGLAAVLAAARAMDPARRV